MGPDLKTRQYDTGPRIAHSSLSTFGRRTLRVASHSAAKLLILRESDRNCPVQANGTPMVVAGSS